MITGYPPFKSDTSEGVYQNIEKGNLQWSPLLSPKAHDIIEKLLNYDSTKRLGCDPELGMKPIRHHIWFSKLDWKKVENRQCIPPYIPPYDPKNIRIDRACQEELAQALIPSKNWLEDGDPFFEMFKEF